MTQAHDMTQGRRRVRAAAAPAGRRRAGAPGLEESRVWPGVRLALSEPELAHLGAQLQQGRRLAPTRPHPHLPPDPEVQRLAGRISGATDRILDVLKGRSRI